MFRFKALELMNWDCYPYYRVPLDGDIILLVGPNGSGKTTFLDALRVLLNSQRLSKGRTLHHYIQKDVELAMIKGVVTNVEDPQMKRRPFHSHGIYTENEVSLVCIIYNRGADKIEKEFYILPQDLSVEEIQKLIKSKEEKKSYQRPLRPLAYSQKLDEAGVSRSTLKLIALEQGQTDRIGQLSPNDLLQLVMDITGNRDIIARYEEARINYRRSSQQLIDLRSEYNKIVQQTQQLALQAKEAQTYKELQNSQHIVEQEKLPLARWYSILNQIATNERNLNDYQQRKADAEKRFVSLQQQQQILTGKITALEQEQQNIRSQQLQQEQEASRLHQQIGQYQSEWQRWESVRQQCEQIPSDLSESDIKRQLEQAKEKHYHVKNQITQENNLLQALYKERDQISSKKRPTFPSEIAEFRKILDENQIPHLLFAEGIEITNTKWQLAIEAFLGRDRFTILVDSKDLLKAKRLGEKHRYGYYVSPFYPTTLPSTIRPNSILANLRPIDARIHGKLLGLNDIILVDTVEEGHTCRDISITVKGYRQDQRGGIFIGKDVRFYCGGLAIERQLNELNEEITEKQESIAKMESQIQATTEKIQECEQQMVLIQRRQEWENNKNRHAQLQKQGEALLLDSQKIEEQRRQVSVQYDKLAEERSNLISEHKDISREKERADHECLQLADLLLEKQQSLKQLCWQRDDGEKHLPNTTRETYTPDKLESCEFLERKLQEITLTIERFTGCRDVSLIPLYEHEQQQLESKKLQLEHQEQDQIQRSNELNLCRNDYKVIIDETIQLYNNAIQDLSKLANCKMRVFLEWGNGDALIEDAKLYAKVAFDKKHEVDIHDKSLSGGQDVISSLILLIALSHMSKEHGSGFFIMDEHNAHLDMLRIMEVGKFLRSTQAQFVLTTPTTENVAALTVADLIMTFSKRDTIQRYAPKPRFIRRMPGKTAQFNSQTSNLLES